MRVKEYFSIIGKLNFLYPGILIDELYEVVQLQDPGPYDGVYRFARGRTRRAPELTTRRRFEPDSVRHYCMEHDTSYSWRSFYWTVVTTEVVTTVLSNNYYQQPLEHLPQPLSPPTT